MLYRQDAAVLTRQGDAKNLQAQAAETVDSVEV
jgi:hypothetical protein